MEKVRKALQNTIDRKEEDSIDNIEEWDIKILKIDLDIGIESMKNDKSSGSR